MDIFDKYATRYSIDLSMAKTRKDKIEIILNEKKFVFDLLFEYLTKEEKLLYLKYANTNNIETFILSLPSTERLSILKDNIRVFTESTLQYIGTKLTSNKEILEYLDLISNSVGEYYMYSIISKISDPDLKISASNKYLKDDYIKSLVIKTLNDEYKIKLLNKVSSIPNKVEIILSFNNKEYIKKYALLKEYASYRSKLVSSTNDEDFIISIFKKIDTLKFRLNLINLITDEKLKSKLYDLIDNENLKKFLFSNNNPESYKVDMFESELLTTKVDDAITFGVELECCNKDIELYRGITSIFSDYDIKSDVSVKSGFEITSPVLHYNIKDLNSLKNVCTLLKENNFYTDYSCGGHIHVGASYFTTEQDFLTLLYLYINTEDILYYICDKASTLKRPSYKRYAKKSKEDYILAIENNLFNIKELDIIDKLKEVNLDRDRGLNFKNLGKLFKNTIEFRMPNGQIEFSELILNIKLFTRLIEVSHKMSKEPTKNLYALSKETDETKKLDILLDILFTSNEEKSLYRNRYFKNKILDLKSQKNNLEQNTIPSNEITSKLLKKAM